VVQEEKKKSVDNSVQTERDRRTYLINREWGHVSNCADDTPWAKQTKAGII